MSPSPSFDDRAADWDTPERADRAASAIDAIRAAVPLASNLRVIELGAGTGLLGLDLAGDVRSVVLTDPSAGMLAEADRKIEAAGLRNVRALRFGLGEDPLPAERFDLAISHLALHHVPDTRAALEALFALLEPGGRIALVDLDAEDGSFHSDPSAQVHHGFDRVALGAAVQAAGFVDVAFSTAYEIARDAGAFPLFLLTARRP
jgi:ubiquinone/menaquinone biosynthesis C-methylase UbiE